MLLRRWLLGLLIINYGYLGGRLCLRFRTSSVFLFLLVGFFAIDFFIVGLKMIFSAVCLKGVIIPVKEKDEKKAIEGEREREEAQGEEQGFPKNS